MQILEFFGEDSIDAYSRFQLEYNTKVYWFFMECLALYKANTFLKGYTNSFLRLMFTGIRMCSLVYFVIRIIPQIFSLLKVYPFVICIHWYKSSNDPWISAESKINMATFWFYLCYMWALSENFLKYVYSLGIKGFFKDLVNMLADYAEETL